MSIVEPVREKILREKAATFLKDVCDSANKLLGEATPAILLLNQLLKDGSNRMEALMKHEETYSEVLPSPDVKVNGQIQAYTALLTKNQHLTQEWQAISLNLAAKLTSATAAHSSPTNSSINTKKPDRPSIDLDSSETHWLFFVDEWENYKRQANLCTNNTIVPELRACCTPELRRALFDFLGPTCLSTITETKLLTEIKLAAVRGKNKAVHRSEFHAMTQEQGQRLQEFVARLKAKAEHCQFTITCPNDSCKSTVCYAEEMISDRMVIGVYDKDIQIEVLAKASTVETFQGKFDLMTSLELGKEAKTALSSESSSTMGAQKTPYQKAKFQNMRPTPDTSNPSDRNNYQSNQSESRGKCFGCGGSLHGRTLREHSMNKKAKCPARQHRCENCGRIGHFKATCRDTKDQGTHTHASCEQSHTQSNFFANRQPQADAGAQHAAVATNDQHGDVATIPHVAWKHGSFEPAKPTQPPRLQLDVAVLDNWHEEYGRKLPHVRRNKNSRIPVKITAVADTGAQSCSAGLDFLGKMNMPRGYLIPTSHSGVAIDQSSLNIIGVALVAITVNEITAHHPVYITVGTQGFYLSHQAQHDLGIIDESYPTPHAPRDESASSTQATAAAPFDPNRAPCGCRRRSKPPPKPSHIPFPPVAENRKKLEDWIKERYRASAFNTCEHQDLPAMTGRPLDIHFEPDAKPKASHTPIPVPHHWKQQVKAGLDRDVSIGTIEQVPQGTPTVWCHRMVIVPKKDGRPRRTVDLQPLNAVTLRETHHTPSPYNQASVVPKNTKKTVLDAWDGYHGLPLSAATRDATTFITEWGRYRYLRAPQGFHAAGDGYTRRYDDITVDIERKTKCVDDTLLWDQDIEAAFWHTLEYIDLCSANGVVFNPTKFHFGCDEVDFAGFTITMDGIKPVQQMLTAILDFPTPTNISGLRSWFGLLNQVSYALTLSQKLEPFRDLLKSTTKWYWDQTLDELFDGTKKVIVKLIEAGVRTFEVNRPTCLATDWSKTGIGYFLLQKHCQCAMENAPNCCHDGWKLVMAGSRFTSGAESRYAPVEGEALAIVEALDKARMFVLGCPDLTIATDHKPLVKLLGDRSLEDIRNPRLLNLKEKTLRYKYNIKHVPGGWHTGPDALSRFPARTKQAPSTTATSRMSAWITNSNTGKRDDDSNCDQYSIERDVEAMVIAALHGNGETEGVRAVTWERIKQAASTDRVSRDLVSRIANGFPMSLKDLPPILQPYWNSREQLTSVDGVAVVGQRVIIPASLRLEVLDNLHSAHQGVSGMCARARTSVYWPGIRHDIERRRNECRACNRMAPSQTREPLYPSPAPAYPFQQVAADYFHLAGHMYLAYADRYTGWVSVAQTDGDAGAQGLIKLLRELFMTFGVPEELSNDGGPPFDSFTLKQFQLIWGVKRRLSSAYYPQSNGRAELAVKTAKRLITENTGSRGQLNTDNLVAALLQHRNTPLKDIGLSPAQMLYGRNLRDTLPLREQGLLIRPEWKLVADDRERALAKRNLRASESYNVHTKELPPLAEGEHVQVQNQNGNKPKRWDKTGLVVENKGNRQYSVKMDGSGRVSLRNRRFMRKIIPMHADAPLAQITTMTADTACNIGDVPDYDTRDVDRQDFLASTDNNGDCGTTRITTDVAVTTDPDPTPVVPLRSHPTVVSEIPLRRSTRPRRAARDLSPSLRGQSHNIVNR